jgi:hypothetical protein
LRSFLLTLALNGPVVVGAYLFARFALNQPRGLTRALAALIIGWAWITVGVQLTGSIGCLAPGPLIAWSALGGAIGAWAWRTWQVNSPAAEGRPPAQTIDSAAVWALGLTLAASVLLLVPSLLGPVKVVSDGPIYHLYFAVRWWKAQRLELVPVPFGESAATYFPANGDAWFAWLLVGWDGDRLARVGQAPFLLLACLAVVAMARRLGADLSASIVAACWFACSAPLLLFSFEPNVDTIFVAGYLASAFFLLRYALRDDGRAALALAGLASGLAWGTKPTATVFIPPLLMLGLLAVILRRGRSVRCRVLDVLVLTLASLFPCVYWFGRNAILSGGNPLYPLDLPILGWIGWFDRQAMSRSPYFLPVDDTRALADILLAVFDPRLSIVWILAVAGLWRIGRRSTVTAPAWPTFLAGSLAILNILLYWLLIPYRTQQRFMLQAVGLAAVPLAMMLDRSRWVRIAATALLGASLLLPSSWPFHPGLLPWDFSPHIPSLMPPLLSTRLAWPYGLLGLVVGSVLAAWLVALAMRRGRSPLIALALASVLAVPAAWGATWVRLDRYARFETFYPPFRDFLPGWLTLEQALKGRTVRIAYAGTNIPYYLFGRDLRHSVQYVRVAGPPERLLHQDHASAIEQGRPRWPDPRPGWDRENARFDVWWQNLQAARIQVLVVTRANPAEGAHNPNPDDLLGFPIERQWAESHPNLFIPIDGVTEADPQFRAYWVRTGDPPEAE